MRMGKLFSSYLLNVKKKKKTKNLIYLFFLNLHIPHKTKHDKYGNNIEVNIRQLFGGKYGIKIQIINCLLYN